MTDKLRELDFDVSQLIATKVFMTEAQFGKEFDSFCKKHYYNLDEENKDEYYYKVDQTYHLFSSITEAQDDADTAINFVNMHPGFERIFELLINQRSISHNDLAKELKWTVQKLNLEMTSAQSFGWFHELRTSNSINASDCVYSLTKFGKLVYEYIMRKSE